MRHITDINELVPGRRYKITNIKERTDSYSYWQYDYGTFQNNKTYIYIDDDGPFAVLESLTPEEQSIIKKVSYATYNFASYCSNKFNSKLINIDKEDLSDKLLNEDEKNLIERIEDSFFQHTREKFC